jgi:hypothetical protein
VDVDVGVGVGVGVGVSVSVSVAVGVGAGAEMSHVFRTVGLQALFFDRRRELRVFAMASSRGIAPRVWGSAPVHEFDPLVPGQEVRGVRASAWLRVVGRSSS